MGDTPIQGPPHGMMEVVKVPSSSWEGLAVIILILLLGGLAYWIWVRRRNPASNPESRY